jgi:hypothetical protein
MIGGHCFINWIIDIKSYNNSSPIYNIWVKNSGGVRNKDLLFFNVEKNDPLNELLISHNYDMSIEIKKIFNKFIQ